MRPLRRARAAALLLVFVGAALVILVVLAGQRDADRDRGLRGPAGDLRPGWNSEPADLALTEVPVREERVSSGAPVMPRAVEGQAEDIANAPGALLLTGVLVRPDGGPTGPGHVVALLELGSDGAPRPDGGRVVVAPEPDGRFVIALPGWASDASVALVGRAHDLHPATLVLRPKRGTPRPDVVLTLTEGARLRGRLTWRGEPLPGWPIDLDLRYGVPGVFGAGEEAFWLGGQLVEKVARATTNVAGRFEFTGLVAERYDLRCGRPSQSIPAVYTRAVEVDGTELMIDLASAALEITVLGAGGALEGADVLATCADGEARFRTVDRPKVLELPPFTEVTLRAEHPTHATLEERFVTGDVGGSVDALLVLRPTVRPALRVRLPGAAAANVTQLTLDLLPSSGAGGERRLQVARAAAEDEFWLAVLPASPGPHSLRLASVGDFQSEVRALDVPEAGVAEVVFSGARGGRFRVEVTSALPTWGAEWRVLDAEGRSIRPAVQCWADKSGETFEWSISSHTDRTLTPDTDVVPAGRYRVEVESVEHATETREFDVHVGQTTTVELQLTPK